MGSLLFQVLCSFLAYPSYNLSVGLAPASSPSRGASGEKGKFPVLPKPPLVRSNNDDRRQWRKQGVAVGAAASKTQAERCGCWVPQPGQWHRAAMTERFNSILLYLRNQFRVNLFQIEFEQFGDAVLLHGDAVEDIGGLHGAAAVGDDDELGLVAHPAQILRKADDVGVIQRGLDLVEDAEGRGVDGEDGEIDADGHQRLLAAGQGFQVLDDLARRGHPDVDAAGEHVALIFQHKAGLAAAEQFGKDAAKVLVDGPEAAVARMDLDTTRTRSAYEKIIADFEQGKTDILIGTQMVSKGLDFDHVSIVGILNADTMLNYPDFRSYERAFQLMAQVAGRAGRKNKRGRVVLQTKSIDHPIIHQVIANDYEDMVGGQLVERQMFHYPPYYRLVYVYLKNHNEALLDQMAAVMADKLRAVFGNRVLGPDKPPVARIQTLFIKKIVVKIEQNAPMGRARELLLRIQREMLADERYKSLIVYYDVDPM